MAQAVVATSCMKADDINNKREQMPKDHGIIVIVIETRYEITSMDALTHV